MSMMFSNAELKATLKINIEHIKGLRRRIDTTDSGAVAARLREDIERYKRESLLRLPIDEAHYQCDGLYMLTCIQHLFKL